MKRKTAKELLAESFRELAESRSIDKITVSDIAANCGYSTATFYRQFRDKYDLIAWDYSRDLEQILERAGGETISWKQLISDISDYYETHKEYLANLFLHTSGHDSFLQYMVEINNEKLRELVQTGAGTDRLSEKTEMCIRAYCLGTVSLTCEWILGRYPVSKTTLREVFEESLPPILRKYVL